MTEPQPDVEQPDVEQPDPLEALGSAIGEPDTAAEDRARVRLGPAAVAAFGRLGELALWWASVCGGPLPPTRLLLAGGRWDVSTDRPSAQRLDWPDDGSVDDALAWGEHAADDAADRGVELVLLCLDRHRTATALIAELCGLDPVEASGWPEDRDLTDEQWMDEVIALRDVLRRTRGLRGRPADLLRALGDPAAAAACAFAVQAGARRTPLLLDGPGAAAVALLARRTCYDATAWWQAAHLGSDPLHERALGSLGLEPLVRLGIAVEDGTAALAGLAVLEQAVALFGHPGLPITATGSTEPPPVEFDEL